MDNDNVAMVIVYMIVWIMIMWLWLTGWGASKYCVIGMKKISYQSFHCAYLPATTEERTKIP